MVQYDELKLLKGKHVCRSNTHPDMKSNRFERLATDHMGPYLFGILQSLFHSADIVP